MSTTVTVEQMKNLNDNDIDYSVEMITKLFGGTNDSDITDTYRTMVESIIKELKQSSDGEVGFEKILEITKSVVSSIDSSVDSSKIEKTLNTVGSTVEQNLMMKDFMKQVSSIVSAEDYTENIPTMDNLMTQAKSLI